MKNPTNKAAKSYLKQVLRGVPYSFRKQLKKELSVTLNELLDEIPEASESEIIARLGSPEVFLSEYYSNLGPADYLTIFSNEKHFHQYCVISIVLIILIIFTSYKIISAENKAYRYPQPLPISFQQNSDR